MEKPVELQAKVARRRRIVLKPGDVIAIPARDGDCFLAVYLGRFRMAGDAMGLLAGRHPCLQLALDKTPVPIARPIFFHRLGLTSGRWIVLDHRPEWLTLFPYPPEYYYAKRYYPHNPEIGPYGSARTVTEKKALPGEDSPLRQLSEAEAQAVGLLRDDFFQSGLMEQVEAYLHCLSETD